jgi:hypothetical protein
LLDTTVAFSLFGRRVLQARLPEGRINRIGMRSITRATVSMGDEAFQGFVRGVPKTADERGFEDMTANSLGGPAVNRRVVRAFAFAKGEMTRNLGER